MGIKLDKYVIAGYENDKKVYQKLSNTMLLLIDYQDKLGPQIAEFDQITERTVILKKAFDIVGLDTVATEQYPKGLGRTDKRLLDILGDNLIVEKTTFDSYTKEVEEFVKEHDIKDVVIAGSEAHVCIYQTIRALLEDGLRVFAVEDCISSYSLDQKERALKNIRDMGAVVVDTEMILFDLIKGSKNEHFKEISNFVKESRKIK